jgi:hypothetical protein
MGTKVGVIMFNGTTVVGDITIDEDSSGTGAMWSGPMSDLPGWLGGGSPNSGRGGDGRGRGSDSGRDSGARHGSGKSEHPDVVRRRKEVAKGDVYDAHEKAPRPKVGTAPGHGDEYSDDKADYPVQPGADPKHGDEYSSK